MKSSSQYSHGVISGGMLMLRARSWPIRHARSLLRVHFFAAVNFIIRMSCWGAPGSGLIKSCRQVLTTTMRLIMCTDTDLPRGPSMVTIRPLVITEQKTSAMNENKMNFLNECAKSYIYPGCLI